MIDRSHAGLRCRTRRLVYTAQDVLPRHSYGTIRYEVDNLDRMLVFVDWDTGAEILVFPSEIDVLSEERPQQSTEREQARLVASAFVPLDYRTAA